MWGVAMECVYILIAVYLDEVSGAKISITSAESGVLRRGIEVVVRPRLYHVIRWAEEGETDAAELKALRNGVLRTRPSGTGRSPWSNVL